jgi:hypothetical protein
VVEVLVTRPNPSFHRTCRGKPRQAGEFRLQGLPFEGQVVNT